MTPFVAIGVIIIIAAIVAMISMPAVAPIFDLEGRGRAVALVALFVIVAVLAYGGYRVLWGAGAATVAFHEKQARQLSPPLTQR